MVVAHRLAPIGHRKKRVDFLRVLKHRGRFVELEAMKVLDAFKNASCAPGAPEVGNTIVPNSWRTGDRRRNLETSAVVTRGQRGKVAFIMGSSER